MSKIFTSRNIMIAVVILLLVALTTGLIVVTLPPKDNSKGTILAENVVPDGRVLYSVETEGAFKKKVSVFLSNVLNSFFDIIEPELAPHDWAITNSALISTGIIDIFSNAGISAEKLLKLGDFLADLDGNDTVIQTIMFFIEVDEETNVGHFASPDKFVKSLFTDVDYNYTIDRIVEATMLTREECAKLFYEMVYRTSDKDRQTVMDALGRSRFVGLFVSLVTVYDSYVLFNTKGGTVASARTAAALAYQIGAELTDLIEEVGADTVVKALGLNAGSFDGERFEEFFSGQGTDLSALPSDGQINDVMAAGSKLAEFMVYASAKAFSATDNMLFESLSKQYDAETKEEAKLWEYLNRIRLTHAVSEGIKAGYASEYVGNSDELAEVLAEVKLSMELLDNELDVEAQSARKAELSVGFAELIDRIVAMDESYGEIDNYAVLAELGVADFAAIEEYVTYMAKYFDDNFVEDGQFAVAGGNQFLGTLAINRVFNVLADMINLAVGKDVIPD